MSATSKALAPASVTVSYAFTPAPVINQASAFRVTITNKTAQALTVTRVVVDVGGGAMPTFNLSGCTPVGTLMDQDLISTFAITWEGRLSIPKSAARTLEFQGGFTGVGPASITFPSVTIVSTPQVTPLNRPGPTVKVK
jgi:hypothetical protein